MGTKFIKKIIAMVCILAMILPISSEVLAKITQADSAAGKTRKFGVTLLKESTLLNGSKYGNFGYNISGGASTKNTNVYRIYTENKDYSSTILCLDKNKSFPETTEYKSLGTANATTLKQAKSDIDAEKTEKIQWLINYAILPEDSEMLKNERLTQIFSSAIKTTDSNGATLDYIKSKITDDDLVFAAQYSLWMITNGLSYSEVIQGTRDGNNWSSLDDITYLKGTYVRAIISYYSTHFDDSELRKKENAEITSTASSTAPSFATGGNYDKTGDETKKIIGNYVYVGPFKINKSTQDYTIDIKFKDKDGKDVYLAEGTNYFIVDSQSKDAKRLYKTKESLEGKDFYIRLNVGTTVRKVSVSLTTNMHLKSATGTVWTTTINERQPLLTILREEQEPQTVSKGKEFTITVEHQYDISLRKYIKSVKRTDKYGEKEVGPATVTNGTRIPTGPIDNTEKPQFNQYEYRHRKDPYKVEVGDLIEYGIKVTNECNEKVTIFAVTDYLPPSGLEYVERGSYTNWQYKSNPKSYSLSAANGLCELEKHGEALSSHEFTIWFKVTEDAKGKVITNIAEVTMIGAYEDGKMNQAITDIDSTPSNIKLPKTEEEWENYTGNTLNKKDLSDSNYYYKGQEDDDDFEKIYVEGSIDLALRKSIETVNGTKKNREPVVDTTPLKNGKTTASYTHSKDPVQVKKGDIVVYTIRVYNEDTEDAYASKITDYIPEWLGFLPEYKLNIQNGWTIKSDATTVKLSSLESGLNNVSQSDFTSTLTDYKNANVVKGKVEIETTSLKNTVLKAYDGGDKLSTASVQVACIVLDEAPEETVFRNIAAITEYKNSQKTTITQDRDSKSNNDLSNFDENNHEDDEDYEKVIIPKEEPKNFDLALRKFITKIDKKDITNRIPKVVYENDKITYEHTKDPVVVVKGQIVTYTIRVYNEGEIDGYAEEIKDDLPEGITYLPDHETNEKYMWEMYDEKGEKTTDVSKAKTIRTPYLSKAESEKRNEDNLIKAFDKTKGITDKNPDYREVQVTFEVTKDVVTDGNKPIVNTAEISKDSGDDIDSTPDNDKDGEDDIDKEYLILKYFDLSLLKYVSKVIVTEDGVVKETETGYDGTENPEPVVKVELNKKKLDKTEVKWVYSIKITNEGEIDGYATEVTDRIPEGLAFFEEDNTEYNWKVKENGIVTTDYLKDTLLKPGESAIVQIVLRWEKSENNLGQKINVAEISEDDNEYDVPDIDSTPNNNKDGEDDQDYAIVVLSINTGSTPVYIVLITTIMVIVASGSYMIYKHVIKG